MDKIRILVIEHSEIIREGILAVLKTQSYKYQVRFSDQFKDINEQIRAGNVDVMLLNPSTYFDSKGDKIRLLRQDAINFGFKLVALVYAYFDEQLLSMFDEVIYINDEEEKILGKLEKVVESAVLQQDDDVAISQRELDVIRLIALGKSNREIADELFISVHTVISHRKNITSKLGIKSVSGLTIYAVINKLIGTEDYYRS